MCPSTHSTAIQSFLSGCLPASVGSATPVHKRKQRRAKMTRPLSFLSASPAQHSAARNPRVHPQGLQLPKSVMTARGNGKDGVCINSPGPEPLKLEGEDFGIHVRKGFLLKVRKSSTVRIFWGNLGHLKVTSNGKRELGCLWEEGESSPGCSFQPAMEMTRAPGLACNQHTHCRRWLQRPLEVTAKADARPQVLEALSGGES